MTRPREDRQSVYFLFQGLLSAVLLLLFIYHHQNSAGWVSGFWYLASALGASLIFLKMAPAGLFSEAWSQIGLFLLDVGVITLTLVWTQPNNDFYYLYLLIVFGTALTRNSTQAFILGLTTGGLFLISGWSPIHGWPEDPEFWIRFNFLCITTALMTILSQDTQESLKNKGIQYQGRVIQLERLATLGQLSGEIAHRIKSPLTTILVNTEMLSLRHKQSPKALEEITQIQKATRHCQEILKDLIELGRIEEMRTKPMDFREPIHSALSSLQAQISRKIINLSVHGLEKPCLVLGERSLLHEAVSALLQNAIDSSERGGEISVSLKSIREPWKPWKPSQRQYFLSIEDHGQGIDPKNLENIFRPFFTTKGDQGTGLGLSAALRILEKHQGTIEASSSGIGQGAQFTLRLNEFIPRASRSGKAGKSARK